MSIQQYVYSRAHTISHIDGELTQDRSTHGFGTVACSKLPRNLFAVLDSSGILKPETKSTNQIVSRFLYSDYGSGNNFAVVGQMMNLPDGNYLNRRRFPITHVYAMPRETLKRQVRSENSVQLLDLVFKENYVESGSSDGNIISSNDWILPTYEAFDEIPLRHRAENAVTLNPAHIEQILYGLLIKRSKVVICAHDDEMYVDGCAGYVLERFFKILPASILQEISYNTNCIAELPDCCNLIFCDRNHYEEFRSNSSYFCVDMTSSTVSASITGKNSWDVSFIKGVADAVCNDDSAFMASSMDTKLFERQYEAAASQTCAYAKATCFFYISAASYAAIPHNDKEQLLKNLFSAYGYSEMLSSDMRKNGISPPVFSATFDRLMNEIINNDAREVIWKNLSGEEFQYLLHHCGADLKLKVKKIMEQASSLSHIRELLVIQNRRIDKDDILTWLRCANLRYEEGLRNDNVSRRNDFEGYAESEKFYGYEIALSAIRKYPACPTVSEAVCVLLRSTFSVVGSARIPYGFAEVVRHYVRNAQSLYEALVASNIAKLSLSCEECVSYLCDQSGSPNIELAFKNIETINLSGCTHDSDVVRAMYAYLIKIHRITLVEHLLARVCRSVKIDSLPSDMTKAMVSLIATNNLTPGMATAILRILKGYSSVSNQVLADNLTLAITVLVCSFQYKQLYELRSVVEEVYRDLTRTVGNATVENIISWVISMDIDSINSAQLPDKDAISLIRNFNVSDSNISIRRRKSYFASSYRYLCDNTPDAVIDADNYNGMKIYCESHGCTAYPQYHTVVNPDSNTPCEIKDSKFTKISVDVFMALMDGDDRINATAPLFDKFFELAKSRATGSGNAFFERCTPFINMIYNKKHRTVLDSHSHLGLNLAPGDYAAIALRDDFSSRLMTLRNEVSAKILGAESCMSLVKQFNAIAVFNNAINLSLYHRNYMIRSEKFLADKRLRKAKNLLKITKSANTIKSKNSAFLNSLALDDEKLNRNLDRLGGLNGLVRDIDNYLSQSIVVDAQCLKQLLYIVKKNKKTLLSFFSYFPLTTNALFSKANIMINSLSQPGSKIKIGQKKKLKQLKKRLCSTYHSTFFPRKETPTGTLLIFKPDAEYFSIAFGIEDSMKKIINADLSPKKVKAIKSSNKTQNIQNS